MFYVRNSLAKTKEIKQRRMLLKNVIQASFMLFHCMNFDFYLNIISSKLAKMNIGMFILQNVNSSFINCFLKKVTYFLSLLHVKVEYLSMSF